MRLAKRDTRQLIEDKHTIIDKEEIGTIILLPIIISQVSIDELPNEEYWESYTGEFMEYSKGEGYVPSGAYLPGIELYPEQAIVVTKAEIDELYRKAMGDA